MPKTKILFFCAFILFPWSAFAGVPAIEFKNPGGLARLEHLCGVAFESAMAETEALENQRGETCLHELKLADRKTLEEVFMHNCVKDVRTFAAKQAPGRATYGADHLRRIFNFRYDVMKRGPCLDRAIKNHMDHSNGGAERETAPQGPTIDKAYDPR